MSAVLDDLDKLTPQVTSQSIEEIPNEMRKTRKIHLLKSEEVQ